MLVKFPLVFNEYFQKRLNYCNKIVIKGNKNKISLTVLFQKYDKYDTYVVKKLIGTTRDKMFTKIFRNLKWLLDDKFLEKYKQ